MKIEFDENLEYFRLWKNELNKNVELTLRIDKLEEEIKILKTKYRMITKSLPYLKDILEE